VILDRLGRARIRSHILTLAYRETRNCLRRESRDAVAVA
jgi:hypothetical protein